MPAVARTVPEAAAMAAAEVPAGTPSGVAPARFLPATYSYRPFLPDGAELLPEAMTGMHKRRASDAAIAGAMPAAELPAVTVPHHALICEAYAVWSTRELVARLPILRDIVAELSASGDMTEAAHVAHEMTCEAVALGGRPDMPTGYPLSAYVAPAAEVPAVTPVTDTVPAAEVPAATDGRNTMTDTATSVDQVDTVPAAEVPVPAGNVIRATVDRAALMDSLVFVCKTLGRPSMPILSFVLVTVSGDLVKLSTGDWYTTRSVDLDGRDTFGGMAALPAMRVRDWVKGLPKAIREVSISAAGTAATLTAGTVSATFDTAATEDLAPVMQPAPSIAGTIMSDTLASLASRGKVTAGTDETVAYLTGIETVTAGTRVTMRSTDRYRLSVSTGTFAPYNGDRADTARIIPAKPLADAAATFARRAGRKAPASVAYLVGQSNGFDMAGFECDGYRIVMRTLDGKFPPVESLFPASTAGTLTVAPSVLVDAVKSATAGASKDDATVPVILAVSADGTVNAEFGYVPETQRPAGIASVMGATITGTVPAATGFNPGYLFDLVASFGKVETVTLGFVDAFKPVVATCNQVDGYRHLLMPIRVTRSVPAAEVPAKPARMTTVHTFTPASIGEKRCSLPGCDRGKTARIHAVPEDSVAQVDTVPAAEVPVTAPVVVDQVDTVPAAEVVAEVPAASVDQADTVPAAKAPTVHTFASTREAYDASQTRDDIRDMDVLVVASEGVAGFLHQAWPIAVTAERGEFHSPAADLDSYGERYAASIAAARYVASVMPAASVDQVDTVPAAEVPAAGDLVDQVRARIAGGTWSIETVRVGKGREARNIASHVFRPAAEFMPRPLYVALAEQIAKLGGSKWNRDAKGFLFAGSEIYWNGTGAGGRTVSGQDRVTAWLAAEVPAASVDQVDGVPAAEVVAEVPAGRVDLVDGRTPLAGMVSGIVPDYMPARILPVGALAAVPATLRPSDFDAYRAEIRNCACVVCNEMSYENSRPAPDMRVMLANARVLMAHLMSGTHEHVTMAELSAHAKVAHTARVDAVRASGATAEEIARVDHWDVYMRLDARAAVRDSFINGSGLGIGNAPIRAEADARRAAEAATLAAVPAAEVPVIVPVVVDQVDTVPAAEAAAEAEIIAAYGSAPRPVDAPAMTHREIDYMDTFGDTMAAAAEVPAVHTDPATVPAAPRGVTLRLVVPDSLVAEVPAASVDQVDTVPAAEVPAATGGELHGAHVQRVHVAGRGEVDGYRFHLVKSINGQPTPTRAIGKDVRVALGHARQTFGASLTVTSPAKSRTINVVAAAGATVHDWPAVLAEVARVIGNALAAEVCSACDRETATADAE